MPRVSPDLVYNPTNLPLVLRFQGMSYTFEPFKTTPFHVSDDLAVQTLAVTAIRTKLGKMGVFVIPDDEIADLLDPDLPEEQQAARLKGFMQSLKKQGQNKFYEHLKLQYEEMPDNDNRRLAGMNKLPLSETATQKRMKNLMKLWETHLSRSGDLSLEEQMEADARAINKAPDIDLAKLDWKSLRKVARERGVNVPRGMTQDELIAELTGVKPAGAAAARAPELDPEGDEQEPAA